MRMVSKKPNVMIYVITVTELTREGIIWILGKS